MAHGLPINFDSSPDASPSQPTLKPVLQEILRTEVYPANLVLLVDKIHHVSFWGFANKHYEAFRVWLSDGEWSIQAVLRHEIHPFFTTGDIREGSYVLVTKYKLSRAKRLNGDGNVACLLIANLHAIGVDERDSWTMARTTLGAPRPPSVALADDIQKILTNPDDAILNDNSSSDQDVASDDGDIIDLLQWFDKTTKDRRNQDNSPSKKRKLDDVSGPLEDVSPNASQKRQKASKESQSPLKSVATLPRNPNPRSHDPPPPESEPIPLRRPSPPPPTAPNMANYQSSKKPLLPIQKPLRLTPLARLTGAYASRNKAHDVLAVVCSPPAPIIRRRGMPPQRDLRIMDPSTEKEVSLTVFVDPEHFDPAVGTVALFRRVITHQWNGGSLKVYEKECGGRRWFIPDPVGVEGCDVEGLRRWWEGMGK